MQKLALLVVFLGCFVLTLTLFLLSQKDELEAAHEETHITYGEAP